MKKDIINRNDNGQLHGIQIAYFSNDGHIRYKWNYINGHKHGIQISYYSNGQIGSKQNYINGHKHGEQIGYYPNGQLSYKDNYINGEYHGEQIGYYDNNPGQKIYNNYFINGKNVSPEEYLAYERKLKIRMISNL
jgi:antitoxin component YwqK of YwqJK toxin-antitoxin module